MRGNISSQLTRGRGWFVVISGGDLLDQSLKIRPIERHGAVDESVEEDTQRPAVHLRAPVRTAPDNFRRGVERRPTEGAEEVCVVEHVGQTEVCYLGTAVLVQQNVLQLEVSVTDIVLKNVIV